MLRLWQAMLLPPPLQPPHVTTEASPCAALPVRAELQPLVGGPTWLPLHVVVLVGEVQYDFLPSSPQSQKTIVGLLSGRAVPGRVRARSHALAGSKRKRVLLGHTSVSHEDLQAFARTRTSRLRLFENDCWTFASAISAYALTDGNGQLRGDNTTVL